MVSRILALFPFLDAAISKYVDEVLLGVYTEEVELTPMEGRSVVRELENAYGRLKVAENHVEYIQKEIVRLRWELLQAATENHRRRGTTETSLPILQSSCDVCGE